MISIASRNKLRLASLFGAIWEAFDSPNGRKNLMIRATRSRSMDGWMDGWIDGLMGGLMD